MSTSTVPSQHQHTGYNRRRKRAAPSTQHPLRPLLRRAPVYPRGQQMPSPRRPTDTARVYHHPSIQTLLPRNRFSLLSRRRRWLLSRYSIVSPLSLSTLRNRRRAQPQGRARAPCNPRARLSAALIGCLFPAVETLLLFNLNRRASAPPPPTLSAASLRAPHPSARTQPIANSAASSPRDGKTLVASGCVQRDTPSRPRTVPVRTVKPGAVPRPDLLASSFHPPPSRPLSPSWRRRQHANSRSLGSVSFRMARPASFDQTVRGRGRASFGN